MADIASKIELLARNGKIEAAAKMSYAEGHKSKVIDNKVQLFTAAGAYYRAIKMFSEACDAYELALIQDEKYIPAYYNRGLTLRDMGQMEYALDAFDEALDIDDNFVQAYVGRADVLFALMRFEECEEAATTYIKAHERMRKKPEDDAYNIRARAKIELKDFQAAIEDAKTSHDNEKSNQAKHLLLVAINAAAKDEFANEKHELALDVFTKYLTSDLMAVKEPLYKKELEKSLMIQALCMLAVAAKMGGSYQAAIAVMLKLLKDVNPHSVNGNATVGTLYLLSKDCNNALKYLSKARSSPDLDTELTVMTRGALEYNLGVALFELQKYTEAKAAFKNAEALNYDGAIQAYERCAMEERKPKSERGKQPGLLQDLLDKHNGGGLLRHTGPGSLLRPTEKRRWPNDEGAEVIASAPGSLRAANEVRVEGSLNERPGPPQTTTSGAERNSIKPSCPQKVPPSPINYEAPTAASERLTKEKEICNLLQQSSKGNAAIKSLLDLIPDDILLDKAKLVLLIAKLIVEGKLPKGYNISAVREMWLSDEKFEGTFGMTKDKFYALKKWKQQRMKKELGYW